MRGLILFCLLLGFKVSAGSLVSLSETRALRELQRFLGAYTVQSRNGDWLVSTLTIEKGQLQFWENHGGRHPFLALQIPLDEFGKHKSFDRLTHYGQEHVEVESLISNDAIHQTEMASSRFWTRVREETLRLDHEELSLHVVQSYYRRRFGLFGRFIRDTTSFEAVKNSFEMTEYWLRLSNTPMSVSKLSELARIGYDDARTGKVIPFAKPVSCDDELFF